MTVHDLILEAVAIIEARSVYAASETRLTELAGDYAAVGRPLSERILRRWAYIVHRAANAELTDPEARL